MAWKAKLLSVPETNDVSDSFNAEIVFHDDATGRSFQRSFKFVAGQGLTLAQARAQLQAQCDALTALDQTKALLLPYVGQDVTN